jgi:hypothetical protein
MKQIEIRTLLSALSIFNPEVGGDMFLRNIDFESIIQFYISEYKTIFNRGIYLSFAWKGLRKNIKDVSQDYRCEEGTVII